MRRLSIQLKVTLWFTLLMVLLVSIVLVFSIGLGIAAIDSRRLHDLNLSSWWLVGAVALLVALNIYGFFAFATYLHLFFIIVLLFPADKPRGRAIRL